LIKFDVSVGSNSEVEARNREVRFTPVIRHRQLGHSGPKTFTIGDIERSLELKEAAN